MNDTQLIAMAELLDEFADLLTTIEKDFKYATEIKDDMHTLKISILKECIK